MADQHPKVLFFGVGSVGAVYLYLLSNVSSTTGVCRSNYDVAEERGFTINSTIFGNDLHIAPNVVRSCEEAAAQDSRPFDYVILTSKVAPGTLPQIIKPAVTPGHTVIALLQNGIGIEEEYAAAFPHNPILSAVTYFPATQRPLGVITHREVERLEVGSYPSSAPNTHAAAFASLFQQAGATAILCDDIQAKRWYKLLLNASWNPICALTLSSDVQFMQSSDGAAIFVLDVMLEVRDIAEAYGYTITKEEIVAQWERATSRVPTGKAIEPSMLQDVKMGRKTEVEAIVGNTARMARGKHIACGKLDIIYMLMKALNARLGADA